MKTKYFTISDQNFLLLIPYKLQILALIFINKKEKFEINEQNKAVVKL